MVSKHQQNRLKYSKFSNPIRTCHLNGYLMKHFFFLVVIILHTLLHSRLLSRSLQPLNLQSESTVIITTHGIYAKYQGIQRHTTSSIASQFNNLTLQIKCVRILHYSFIWY